MPARRRADETVRDRLIVLRRMMRPLVFHSTPRNRLRHAEPGARFLGLIGSPGPLSMRRTGENRGCRSVIHWPRRWRESS